MGTRKTSSFDERCYALLCQVPKGKVTTYREIARGLRSRGYRAVGGAMNRNPNAPKVPCHRVVRSDGTLGGYAGGLKKKVALLKREGVRVVDGRVADMERVTYRF